MLLPKSFRCGPVTPKGFLKIKVITGKQKFPNFSSSYEASKYFFEINQRGQECLKAAVAAVRSLVPRMPHCGFGRRDRRRTAAAGAAGPPVPEDTPWPRWCHVLQKP